MRFTRSFCFVMILLSMNTGAFAQFSFDKIKDSYAYEPPKKVSFFSNSHFNRVEAFYLNLGVKLKPARLPGFAVIADGGYGFKNEKSKRWRYNVGVQKDFMLPERLTLGAEYFDEVFSQDAWIISPTENSLAAIFSHNDYMDYIGRKGGMVFLDYRMKQLHALRLEVLAYKYELLQKNSDWSLFARKKSYPENPQAILPFAAGNETAVRAMTAFDFRDNPIFPIVGWYFEGIIEKTFDDFATTGLFLTAKRFQPTFGNQRLKAKLLFGTRSGSFAFQHLLGLGGVGNLRGYVDKEFVGNRLLYGTLQYNFGGDVLQKIPLDFIPFWETMSLGVFADFGDAWIADPADKNAGLFNFGGFALRDIRSDVGLSLIFTEGLLRIDFARRTDHGNADWQVYFRLLDKF